MTIKTGDLITAICATFDGLYYLEHSVVYEVHSEGLSCGERVANRALGWVWFKDENIKWLRGHHERGSDEVRAALAAQALLR
jgi:hypothetical protein